MGGRGRGGRHVGSGGVVTVLIRGVLHLHQLALGGEEAVAAGHQHGGARGVTHLLPGATVIIGEIEVVSAIFSGRIVQDTECNSDVAALSSLSFLIHKVGLLKVLAPALSPASLLPPVSPLSLIESSSAGSTSAVAPMVASVSLSSPQGWGLEALVKLGKV